jgi:isopentenyl diphosphate isomerase/L-lactate dehydrogenase-like FMN-dependent dehydrogenase
VNRSATFVGEQELTGDGLDGGAPDRGALDYCFGAAGDESTMNRNVAGLDEFVLVPRMLPGRRVPITRTTVTGGEVSGPFVVAPMGLQSFVHPAAETATATAAVAAGVGFCLSTFSYHSPEEVASAAGTGLRWLQVYVLRAPELTAHLVAEAERLGFSAIVCTLDVPVVGRRTRDTRNNFDRFAADLPAIVRSRPFVDLAARRGLSPRALLDEVFPNPECTWDDIASVIASTRLPVLLKGILHTEDARRALDIGAAGIVVSNHGGRQFDRSITSVDALPGIVRAIDSAVPVYLDSGVRTATHAAVALALGARAVLLGRPVLAALASGRQSGAAGIGAVTATLRGFVDDLAHVMMLVGASGPEALTGTEVFPPVRRHQVP